MHFSWQKHLSSCELEWGLSKLCLGPQFCYFIKVMDLQEEHRQCPHQSWAFSGWLWAVNKALGRAKWTLQPVVQERQQWLSAGQGDTVQDFRALQAPSVSHRLLFLTKWSVQLFILSRLWDQVWSVSEPVILTGQSWFGTAMLSLSAFVVNL